MSDCNADNRDEKIGQSCLGLARPLLDSYRNNCRTKLNELMEQNLNSRFENIDEYFREVMIEMARALFEIGIIYKRSSSSDDVRPFDLYFWPGFVTWDGERLALECDHNDKQCGIGYTENMNITGPGYRITDASFSFNLLLDPLLISTLPDGTKFAPAGTHNWATYDGQINHKPITPPELIAENKKSLLTLLSVGIGQELLEKAIPDHDFGDLTIYLKIDDSEQFGQQTSQRINESPDLSYLIRWPCPSPISNLSPIERYRTLSDSENVVTHIREALYSVWLSTCFIPDWRNTCHNWIDGIRKDIRDKYGLIELSDRIAHLIDNDSQKSASCKSCSECRPTIDGSYFPHTYRWWFTILLDKVVEVKGRNSELGSGMILCSHELESEYFSLAKPWVEEIYTLMRQVEDATRIESEITRLAEERIERENQEILASFARGASHGLKNALALPQLAMGNQNHGQSMCEMLDSDLTPDEDYLYKLADSASFMFNELAHLREQAELFFWVMDFDRAKRDVAKNIERSIAEITCSSIIRGLNLSTNGHKLQLHELLPIITKIDMTPQAFSDQLSGVLREAVGQIHGENGDASAWWYEHLLLVQMKVAGNTSLSLKIPSRSNLDGHCSGITAYILDAVILELCQNAFKAAILSVDSVPNPFVSVDIKNNAKSLIIEVSNSANPTCIENIRAFESRVLSGNLRPGEGGSGGIQGLWQVYLLCNRLGGTSVRLLNPSCHSSLVVSEAGQQMVRFFIEVSLLGG